MQRFRQTPRSRPAPSIEPSLGWTYLSREALARAKAQMDAESTGVRDELGFLTIHQRYADRFFPGTSVLHGRARYALFVPWLFEDMAGLSGTAAKLELQERERLLAGRLRESEPHQVIGGNVYPRPASQPPSTVYWNALASWGILRSRENHIPTRAQVHRLLQVKPSRLDADGQPLLAYEPPFVVLPERPPEWSNGRIDLRLTRTEADFLYERLAYLPINGTKELSLLARLVRTRAAAPESMWSAETLAVARDQKPFLERARQVASLAGLGRAVYDALLEHLVHECDSGDVAQARHEHLQSMLPDHMESAAQLDVDSLERDIGPLPGALRDVVTATRTWAAAGSTDPLSLRDVYTHAEARKGVRARLAMTRDGQARRREWVRDSHSWAQPLHFRWDNVSILLNDLANAA
ncbi:DUF6361 family protein [Pseudomonas asplenii]|uniref:DUF6361 family protein n=1 Tax=Pseudomonas asplenii TaxID=53407 RepID=UPI000688A94E|nr:DUF6361 family protein [Pseudomonas fuscovaginae]